MDFQKKDWQFRDVISENELNRMEDGIEEGITKAEQAQQSAQNKIDQSEKGQPGGVATLDASGKVPESQLPELPSPVTSVNGKTGDVVLTASDVGAETPAGAQAKVDAHASRTDNPHSVTKAQVGLGSVQNYGIASQAQAEAGTANNVYMTPLRTKNYVDTRLLNDLQFRLNNGAVEYNDGTGWKSVGKGGVKSIQQGTFAISAGSTSVDVAISPVNTINSIILISSVIGGATSLLTVISEFVDNSTIRFTRSTTTSTVTQNWVVIEYDL